MDKHPNPGNEDAADESSDRKTHNNRVETRWMILLKFLVFALIGYAAMLLLAYLFQDRIIFPATRAIYRDPSAFGWEFSDVILPVNGHTTHGWFIPLENARGVALFSHGNAGNIADRLESIGLLRELGFSVLAYDYGGYGKSSGRVSEQRCCADARAMWRHLTETLDIPAQQILIFGRSLGGAVSADLAAEVNAGVVVLESTFLSIRDVARDAFPWLPVGWFLRHHFESKHKVSRISSPLLIIHSPDDRVIPYRHGKELFRLAAEPKQFLEIHGDHNDGFVLSAPVYLAGWEAFLAPILPKPPES